MNENVFLFYQIHILEPFFIRDFTFATLDATFILLTTVKFTAHLRSFFAHPNCIVRSTTVI